LNDKNDKSDSNFIEKDKISFTQPPEVSNELQSTPSTTKTNLIKKEITVDQSPLEEVKNNFLNSTGSDFETQSQKENDPKKHESNINENNINDPINQNRELRLTICEKNKANNLNRSFKLLIDDLILSISPFIIFQMPYLLVETSTDSLKSYLPRSYMNYLKSNILLQDFQDSVSSKSSSNSSLNNNNISNYNRENNESLHEFLLVHLTKSLNDEEIKKLYADYKSRGGIAANNATRRLMLANIETNKTDSNNKLVKSNTKHNNPKQLINSSVYDCLDLYNRQHLAVLFCTQCETSPVYPNMCHKPKIVDMKFYGENDMTLGSFLAKNCFRNGYKCNNESCDTLIVFHTRSFVHADSKITVRMSIVPTANQTNQQSAHILNNNQNSLQSNTNTTSGRSLTNKDDTNNSSFANLNVSALTATYSSTSKLTSNQKNQSSLANNQASILSIQSLVSSNIPPPQSSSTNSNQNKDNLQPASNTNNQQQAQNFVYDDINIFMWSVCKICNKSTKKIPMAPDTWSYSLAKFLELTFHAKNYTQFNNDDEHKCKHSLFQDHYQYFRFKNIVTVFSTSKITIRALNLPIIILKSNV
jgi:hypothetical protein